MSTTTQSTRLILPGHLPGDDEPEIPNPFPESNPIPNMEYSAYRKWFNFWQAYTDNDNPYIMIKQGDQLVESSVAIKAGSVSLSPDSVSVAGNWGLVGAEVSMPGAYKKVKAIIS